MKVDNMRLGPDKVAQKYNRRIESSESRSKGKSEESGIFDSIQISDEAKLLSKAKANLSNMPSVREDKVDKIRQAIASGSYKIDSNTIAEKMVDKLRVE